MKTNFVNGVTFTPTKFSTLADKCKFANQFMLLVTGGFQQKHFPKWFYQQLSCCRGHIAHYNQGGFWDEWFADKESQLRFLKHWLEIPIYGDPAYTYSDVERYLQTWIGENPQLFAETAKGATSRVTVEMPLEAAEKIRRNPAAFLEWMKQRGVPIVGVEQ